MSWILPKWPTSHMACHLKDNMIKRDANKDTHMGKYQVQLSDGNLKLNKYAKKELGH